MTSYHYSTVKVRSLSGQDFTTGPKPVKAFRETILPMSFGIGTPIGNPLDSRRRGVSLLQFLLICRLFGRDRLCSKQLVNYTPFMPGVKG